jgi:ABC-2 type transport system permease protein
MMNFLAMNYRAIAAIFRHQIASTFRFPVQSIVSPILSTVLYFIVFGAGIGGRINAVDGISYGAFIVPGLIMQGALSQSVSNATTAIYFPRFTGTIYEILSAPLSYVDIVAGYVGAAATKAVAIGLIVLATAWFFTPIEILHPFWMLSFLLLTCVTFSLLGFILGIWADSFEQLSLIPLLVITPLSFLGGSFYSIKMLPPLWQEISLANPVVYLISAFRWSFYGTADVGVGTSLAVILAFLAVCLAVTAWIFKTGYRLRS